MPFTIDEELLLIKGRRGDSASFTFNFNRDISGYTVHFYVKKNVGDDDAIITKEYINPTTHAVTVDLSATDTEKLSAQINSYSTYYWGLKINCGNDFVQTIIPQDFKSPPMMQVYPMIGEV